MSGFQGEAREERDERVLELLLARTPAAERELAALDDADRVRATRAWLARLRREARAAAGLGPTRERRLVERVLARTTRADSGAAGDLRLFGRFVGDRLSSSRALRLVVAALLLEIFVVPVVALLLRSPAVEPPRIRFEFPRESAEPAFADDVEEDLGVDPGDLEEPRLARATEAERAAFENAALRDRFVLTTRRGPLFDGGETLAGRLLAARALASGAWETSLDERADELAVDRAASALERVLLLELLLDRFALSGERSRALDAVAASLDAERETADASGELARAALARAFALGALEAPGFDPADVEPPLGSAWFELLSRALGGSGPPAGLAPWFEWRP